jgi:hypothetical protein
MVSSAGSRFLSLPFDVFRWTGEDYRHRQSYMRPLSFIPFMAGLSRPLDPEIFSTVARVRINFHPFFDSEC